MKIQSPRIITQLNVSGSGIITGSLNVIGPISSSGDFVPTTLTQDLGTVTNPWRELFVSTASINFSDGNETVKILTIGNLVTTESLEQQVNPFLPPSTFQLLNQVSGSVLVDLDLGPLVDITLNDNIQLSFTASIDEDQFRDFTLIVRGLNEFNLSTNGISLEPPGGVSSSPKERNVIKGQFLGNGTVFYDEIKKLEDREEIYADSEYVVGGYY